MKLTVRQIAEIVGGEIEGNPDMEITHPAKIDEQPGRNSLCFLANPKYEKYLYDTQATAVLISKDLPLRKQVTTTLIKVADPYSAFRVLLEEYEKILNTQYTPPTGIEEPVKIDPSATLGEHVYVGAFTYIGKGVRIGDHVRIFPHSYIADQVSIGAHTVIHSGVRIYERSRIGEYCTLHAGVVIGSEGFGYTQQEDGTYRNIPQLGNVVIESRVNIGANTTIDRATIGSTIIRQGVKLDNLIQIGHNAEIGENTVISAQTGVSGSSKIGKNCVVGGQVGFANSIRIADNTKVGAKSGINRTIKEPGNAIQGYPAFDHRSFMKSSVIFRKLPELMKDLFRRIEKLEEKSEK